MKVIMERIGSQELKKGFIKKQTGEMYDNYLFTDLDFKNTPTFCDHIKRTINSFE
jgi:hypothetical protein